MQTNKPTPAERAALLRFEEAYARWCGEVDALVCAEIRLWTAALRGVEGDDRRRLGAEVVRLRGKARTAYRDILGILHL